MRCYKLRNELKRKIKGELKMLNEKIQGFITGVSAGVKTVKDEDGSKFKIGTYKVKLESAEIDYESIARFNPSISATLLNIQPIPFKSVNFGDQSAINMSIRFYKEDEESINEKTSTQEMSSEANAEYSSVMINNLTVTVKENIPVYQFLLEIPMTGGSGSFLFHGLKSKISFEFLDGGLMNKCINV